MKFFKKFFHEFKKSFFDIEILLLIITMIFLLSIIFATRLILLQ
jgi:hypothetical protein